MPQARDPRATAADDFQSVLDELRGGSASTSGPTDLPGVPRMGVASHANTQPPPPDTRSPWQRGVESVMDYGTGIVKGIDRMAVGAAKFAQSVDPANFAFRMLPPEAQARVPESARPGYMPPWIDESLAAKNPAERLGGTTADVASVAVPMLAGERAGTLLARPVANILQRGAVPELSRAEAEQVLARGAGMPTARNAERLATEAAETRPPQGRPIRGSARQSGVTYREVPRVEPDDVRMYLPPRGTSPLQSAADKMATAAGRSSPITAADLGVGGGVYGLASHGLTKTAIAAAAAKLAARPLPMSAGARLLYALGPAAETGGAVAANVARDQPSDTDSAASSLREAVTRLLSGPPINADGAPTTPGRPAPSAPPPAAEPPIARGRGLDFLPTPRAAASTNPALNAPASSGLGGMIAEQLDQPTPAYTANPKEFESKLDRIKQRVQAETGYGLKVISGLRTADQQAQIFADQQKTGKKATNADGRIVESKHQSGEAADLRFVDQSGKVITPKGNDKLWQALGKIAKEEGLVWGGDWTDPYDPGHVQLGVELKRNQ